jgi:3-hydroxymyristoyl/3-hydroxydecanoyl-(acyl carrier protein) dehydratase
MRFLFVDRILHLVPGQLVQGVKHITPDDLYLCPDDLGQLCFMPSMIGETLGQLAAWNVMVANDFRFRPVAGVVSSASLHRPAYVGETLLLESVIDALDETAVQYHSIARVGHEVVFRIEGALGPLLPMADFIDDATVRRQFAEINRPGDWPPVYHSNEIRSFNKPVMSLQFDRIISSEAGVQLVAEKRISRMSPYFPDHFPEKPVLPMTVLLECKLNLAREFVARAGFNEVYLIHELRKIKMNEFVLPGDVLTTCVTVKRRDEQALILNFRSEVDGKRVCVLDIIMKNG